MRDRSRALRLFFLLTLAAILATPAPATVHQWSQSFGDSETQATLDVAVDGDGNVITTGYNYGSVDFGGGPLASAGYSDIFVAKHGPDGFHVWSMGFGSMGFDTGSAVAVDGEGNVIVTGYFSGSTDFGGGPLTSAGEGDVFLAKFSPLGAHLWSIGFGGALYDDGVDVAVDSAGYIFLAGQFQEEMDLGGGPLTSKGDYDIFLARFSPNGAHVWSKSFGSSGFDRPSALALDRSGNPVFTGETPGPLNFGGGALHSVGMNDIFVAKFTADGVHMWSQSHGSMFFDNVGDIALDSTDAVLLTGSFPYDPYDSITFPPLPPLTGEGGSDVFLVKLSPSGAGIWSASFGDGSDDQGRTITVDDYDNVITAGRFQGSIDFGLGPLVSAGDWDIYLAKFDSGGSVRWAESFGSPDYEWLHAVDTDDNGDILVTGLFRNGSIDFGGGPLIPAGGLDIFLAKLGDTDLPGAAIGDRVWEDTNGDGIQDTGEEGLEGLSVELYDEIGSLLDFTLTGTDGRYRFEDLTWGQTYRLRFFLPVRYEFSPQDQGSDDERDSDADPADGYTPSFPLESASDGTRWDAGMTPPTKGGGGGGGPQKP